MGPSSVGTEKRHGALAYDLLLVVVLAGLGWLYVSTAATVESFGSDTSTYFELARSIRHQHRYWFNFGPHTTYPPGYPLLLAGLMVLSGETFGTLVKLSIPIYFAGLVGLYVLIRMLRGPPTALAVVLLVATSRVAYFWSTVGLHSDVPYFTVSIYALLFVEIATKTSRRWVRLVSYLLVAVAASYLVLLRSIGVTFVGALMLWTTYPHAILSARPAALSLDRGKKWLPVALLPLLVLFAWMVWTSQHPPSDPTDYMQSYARQILKADPHQVDSPRISVLQLPARMVQMLGVRTANAVLMVFSPPPIYLTWYNPVCVLFLVTVALGLWTSLRREGMVLDCYMLSYTGMILLYPFDEGTRYLFSIHPFILLYGIDGLDELRRHGERLGARLGGVVHTTLSSRALFSAGKAVLLGAIVAAGLYQISILARQNLHPDPTKFRNATTVDVAAWVRENARDGDVIIDDQPAILHRLTGRKTLRFPLTTDPKLIAESIVANHVSLVVVLDERPFEYYNPSTVQRFGRVKGLHPEWFAPVHVFDRGTIYRVRREGDSPLSPNTPL